jgi:Alginate export
VARAAAIANKDAALRTLRRKKWLAGMIGVGVLLVGTPLTFAQRDQPDSFLNQQRAVDRFIREQRSKLAPSSDDVDLDFGGFLSTFGFLYDDGVESSRTMRRFDLRLWGSLSLDGGAHEFYARSRLSLTDFNGGDEFDRENDWEGMNLERGYYKFDLGRMVAASGGGPLGYNIEMKIGRDFTQFGTGYVLATPLDQVWLRGTYQDFQVTGLVGKTIGSMQDFDLIRNPQRTRRTMMGTEVRYVGFERHEPFAYVLWQRDHISDNVPGFLQRFDYDSFYAGLGSTGELAQNLRYSTEWVFESGRSYGDARSQRKNRINAWAWDVELEYLFDSPKKPRVGIEYMFASGESDRLLSPTDAVGGVSRGRTDESFIGFGYRDTGLSFAPRLSNIHIWRAGASFFPLAGHEKFDRLELGTNWFVYYKHRAAAAVSDPTATVGSGYLGWEMDYHANWAVTSDVSATARYGVFFPGKAFVDRTTRTFLLVGLTWSF